MATSTEQTPVPDSAASTTDDRVVLRVDPHAAHPTVVIPASTKPINTHPVSGSRTARGVIAGLIVGSMGGVYVALSVLQPYPVAAAAVIGGSTVGGALVGYLASRPKKHS